MFPVGQFLFPEATTAPRSCVSFLETFHACTSVHIYIIYIYIKKIQCVHTCVYKHRCAYIHTLKECTLCIMGTFI